MGMQSWLDEPWTKAEKDRAAEKIRANAESLPPFDPRADVSADAKAIIRRLTLLLLWLPLGCAVLAFVLFNLAK
jgi:hypothetical protein